MAIGSSLSAFGSDWAGRGLQAWSENQAKQSWGIFSILGGASTDQSEEPGVFGRALKVFTNSLLPDSSDIFPQASVVNLRTQSHYAISSAPQEDGSFVSYNKVKQPLASTVRLVCDGSQHGGGPFSDLLNIPDITGMMGLNVRQDFMTQLDLRVADTGLYMVRSPEIGWKLVNIVGYDIVRDDRSISMIEVDVMCEEVRMTATAGYAASGLTKQPQGAAVMQQGNVQPQTPASSGLDATAIAKNIPGFLP